MKTRQLTDVTGIGSATAAQLGERGIRTVEDLKNATVEAIRAIPGFGVARAEAVRRAAARLLGEMAGTPAPRRSGAEQPEGAGTGKREKGKGEKGKREKGKDKKKDKKKPKKRDKEKKKKKGEGKKKDKKGKGKKKSKK